MLARADLYFDPYVCDRLKGGYAQIEVDVDGEALTAADLDEPERWDRRGAGLVFFWVRATSLPPLSPREIPLSRRRRYLLLVPSCSDGRGHPGMTGKFLGYLPRVDLLVWYF